MSSTSFAQPSTSTPQPPPSVSAAASAVASIANLALTNPGAVPPSTHFCIDVECVATGTTHNDRAVAQIALVDQYERVLLNAIVRPQQPVVSYLTPLTGITRDVVEQRGVPLERALEALRRALPSTAVLVGQNIMQDVRWLGLVEGRDYSSLVDLAGLFRVFNPRFNSFSVWSQDHLASVLLGWPVPADEGVAHDAAGDAAKSMRLFALHAELKRRSLGVGGSGGDGATATTTAWQDAERALLSSQPTSSFAKRNPVFEGVCMGGKKTCCCGGPFFF